MSALPRPAPGPEEARAPAPAPPPARRAPRGLERRDLEFLPAALEVVETPPSPVRNALMLLICALAAVALAWSWIGRVDVVAVAQGKVQPAGRVKTVQPLEAGRVVALNVANGVRVTAGQPLLELDAAEARAEDAGASAGHSAALAEVARRRAALKAASADPAAPPDPDFPAAVPAGIREREVRALAGDLAQLVAALASLDAQRRQKEAEAEGLALTIASQSRLVGTLQERVNIRQPLATSGSGTKAALIDAMESYHYHSTTLSTQRAQLVGARAALDVLASDRIKTLRAFLAENAQKLADAERSGDDLEQRLTRARARLDRLTLRSPIDGTVQALSVNAVGQVVGAGEEVMRVVPEGAAIEVEAYLLNKDAGFVREGQEAVIKLEAFPFTRYGAVAARVTRVAGDAIPEPDAARAEGDPKAAPRATGQAGAQRVQNLVFPVTVVPASEFIEADGRRVPLTPGLAVTVEVKTGQRRILEVLLSPIAEVGGQALRER